MKDEKITNGEGSNLEAELRKLFGKKELSPVEQSLSIRENLGESKEETKNEIGIQTPEKSRYCSKCKNTMLISKYKYNNRLMGYCKECWKKYQKELYSLKRGTNEDICPICQAQTKLVFDHDHVSNKHRGNICRSCNSGLGMFMDSIDNLSRAISYLMAFNNKKG